MTDIRAIYTKLAPDWDAIALAIANAAEKDAGLRLRLASIGARAICSECVRDHRASVVNHDAAEESDLSKRGLAVGVAWSWYSYPIANGIELGDATHKDLAEAVKRRLDEATAKRRTADWLRKIAAELPNGNVSVRAAIKESAIASLAKACGVAP